MRIQLNISEELNDKLDSYSKRFGVKKTDVIKCFISYGIEYYDSLCNPRFVEFFKYLISR